MSRNWGTCNVCHEYERRIRTADQNGLYATAIPAQATSAALYEYFSQYGRIQDFHFADNGVYCLVSYEDWQSAAAALHNPVYFYGRILSIRPRRPNQRADDDTEVDLNVIHPDRIVPAIASKNDFRSQIKELVTLLEVEADWPDKYERVCRDVESALESSLPGCRAMPFGSTVSGLAFKGSDVDIYVQQGSDGPKLGCMKVFDVAEKAIRKKQNVFTNITSIAHARVPIVKFVHKSTGIKCDVSFKNLFGVQNSKLLYFLLSLDDRIKPLMVTIKYWAKIHKLTGKRMSNYALSLLVVCFLQSLSDPIVPPISDLQPKDLPDLDIDGWNANFDDDVTKLRPISNNYSLEELLCRFFERVATSNFDDIVLCPLVGEVIAKKRFDSLTLPRPMARYKRYIQSKSKTCLRVDTPLCVQDYAELNINVTQGVRPLSLQCLKEHCSIAAKICHSAPVDQLLPLLLSQNFTQLRSQISQTNGLNRSPVRSTMTLHIPYAGGASSDSMEELSVAWRDKLYDLVIKIYKDVLKLVVETIPYGEAPEPKPGSNRILRCRGHKILWRSRDIIWKKRKTSDRESSPAEQSLPDQDKEEDITIVQIAKKNKSKVFEIDIEPDRRNEGTHTRVNDVAQGNKRKHDSEENRKDSKAKKQRVGNSSKDTGSEVEILDENSSQIDLIVLDSEAQESPRCSRTLEEEIQLSDYMVRWGHAKSANHTILDYECILSKENTGVRIEIADRRSRESYFSSLCIFLEEHLPDWLLAT